MKCYIIYKSTVDKYFILSCDGRIISFKPEKLVSYTNIESTNLDVLYTLLRVVFKNDPEKIRKSNLWVVPVLLSESSIELFHDQSKPLECFI